jgi:anti-sigma factor RsiW
MDEELQLKLQAFLDGELPENEARDAAALIARDSNAAALVAELRHTRQAFAQYQPGLKVPESREFYWSKIHREIQHLEPAPRTRPEASPLITLFRRLLVPTSTVAIVALAAVLAGLLRPSGGPDTDMMVADADTFTYHDYANGTTLVWVSFPGER